MEQPRPRRPVHFGPSAMEAAAGAVDPEALVDAAHATARVLVDRGRAAADPEITGRLVRLVEEHGLDEVAELWAERPARSLPGALWRLHVLRAWVRRDPVRASTEYRAGRERAAVAAVVAGAAEPPTPEALQQVADVVLAGVFEGDLAVTLERAAAFCRVVSAGRALTADDDRDHDAMQVLTRSAGALLRTAEDLEASARLWRADALT